MSPRRLLLPRWKQQILRRRIERAYGLELQILFQRAATVPSVRRRWESRPDETFTSVDRM